MVRGLGSERWPVPPQPSWCAATDGPRTDVRGGDDSSRAPSGARHRPGPRPRRGHGARSTPGRRRGRAVPSSGTVRSPWASSRSATSWSGAARTMLELARQHALERVQFGRPITIFQAVRHRLADSLIALEAADGLLAAAWDEPERRHWPPWPRAWRGAGRAPWPGTPNRSWPGSASPPSIRSTATAAGRRARPAARRGQRAHPPIGDRRARHGYPASSLRALIRRPAGRTARTTGRALGGSARLCLIADFDN